MGMKCHDFYAIHEDVEMVKSLGSAAQWKSVKLTVRAKVDQSGYSQSDFEGPQIRYSLVRCTEHVSSHEIVEANKCLLNRLQEYKNMPNTLL